MEEQLVTIGKITKNQGNKGEVRVLPLTDFPERFEFLEKVYLKKGNDFQEKVIEAVWFHKQFVILKFEGIDDIGAAFDLQNYLIQIKERDLVPLAENEYYIYQLIDCKVKTTAGKELGILKEVLPTGGADILVIKGPEKEYMVPGAREIVQEINLEKKQIIIQPVPGLLDL